MIEKTSHKLGEDICNMYCKVSKKHKEIKLKSNRMKPPIFKNGQKIWRGRRKGKQNDQNSQNVLLLTILRETRIKLDATLYPSDCLQNVKPDNMRCWKGSGKEELAYSTSGSENEYNCFDVKLPISSKAENLHSLWPRKSSSRETCK